MSLFACEQCNVVENTALCGLMFRREDTGELVRPFTFDHVALEQCGVDTERALICSQCNPDLGKWHDLFRRVDADEAGYKPIPGSPYITMFPEVRMDKL